MSVDVHNDVALLTAIGDATLTTYEGSTSLRHRLTGVLQRVDERWLWHTYHGSEPATS